MKNGPELWDRILSHFPDSAFLAGGAIRDYYLGVEPKDFDIFQNYSDYNVGVEGMNYLDNEDRAVRDEEYAAVREIAIVMKGEIEGVKVDYIGTHWSGPGETVEAFDTGINQVWYPKGGLGFIHRTLAFDKDLEQNTVTILHTDRLERTRIRFERFNAKHGGRYKLIEPDVHS